MSVKENAGAGCGVSAGINSPSFILPGSSAPMAAEAKTETTNSNAAAMTNPKLRTDDAAATEAPPNRLWGGRFAGGPAAIMRRINASIDFDRRLYAEDIAGSKAHCVMLVAQCILSAEDGAAITAGLEQIQAEIDAGSFVFREDN